MRAVSLESAEPLIAGTQSAWTCRIVIGPAGVPAGGCVKVAYDLRGESGYQSFPQGDEPGGPNFASVVGPCGVELALTGYTVQHALHSSDALEERVETESYLWRDLLGIRSSLNLHIARVAVLSGELQPGNVVTITYGDRDQGSPGMTVPGQSNAYWQFWVATQRVAEAPLELIGGDFLSVHPGEAVRLNVVAPSVVAADEDVLVKHVALDAGGNPVCKARVMFPPPSADEVEPDQDDGAGTGVDRVEIEDMRVGLAGVSNPMEVADDPELRLFWGDIHGHTVMSDGGARTPHEYYQWGKDCAMLDFCALTDHDFGIALYDPQKNWEAILQANRDYDEPGNFVTIPGWEISHAGLVSGKIYGHKNIYFLEDDPPFYSSSPYGKERAHPTYEDIDELIALLEEEGLSFLIVDHTSHMMTDWDVFDSRYDRLVEVYSFFGGSEAMDVPDPVGPLTAGRTARDGLDRGYRLGFTAGTDTHMGAPAAYRETSFGRGHVPGLTAVWADELTREAVLEALWSRHTYATRGGRILLRTDINGWAMGDGFELLAAEEPRQITISLAGTSPISSVEIIHNGAVLHSWSPKDAADLSLEFEHTGPMKGLPQASGVGYYYVRVLQDDGGAAWSSPTWATLPGR